MKYYVLSDVHGFYSIMINKLKEVGYFDDKEPHKLVIVGDLFDRGNEPKELQEFICDLIDKDEIILIKGNHEDLVKDLVNELYMYNSMNIMFSHHYQNGTVQTILDLTDNSIEILDENPGKLYHQMVETPYFKKIIPVMKNYFETKNYVFTHGWIPCYNMDYNYNSYVRYNPDWRNSTENEFYLSRWINGMEAWNTKNFGELNKTVVCGHYHTSWGHSILNKECPEFGEGAKFTPFIEPGIIAIDACTAYSKIMNCVIIEDEEL